MKVLKNDSLITGSREHLKTLLDFAICRTEKLGIPFRDEDYKWLLGIKVINDLMMDNVYQISVNPDRMRTLFGIAVEPDFHNPDNIQLWENITNKV